MQKLTVLNFGPVQRFEISLSKINILIGPQASGKSTIARLLYFMKMIALWLGNFSPDSSTPSSPPLYQFKKFLRKKFVTLFGPVSYQCDLYIKWEFSKNCMEDPSFIEIRQNLKEDKKYLEFVFDRNLNSLLRNFLEESAITDEGEVNVGVIAGRSLRTYYDARVRQKIIARAKSIFQEDNEPIFVPAGRSLLTLLSGQLSTSIKYADFIMEDFLGLINDIRPQVGQGLEEIAEIARRTWSRKPDKALAALARKEIEEILRGQYSYTNGEERISHGNSFTKLAVASSGQQEALWVVLLAYMLILEKAPVFSIFEEPEAHLYPVAQYAMSRLLALLLNANENNQIFITTHSPYILVAFNNLLAAGCEGKKRPEMVDKIIPESCWLEINEITALSLNENGNATDILAKDLCMIKAEKIDSASAIMNEEYDRIQELADKVESFNGK